MALEVKKIILRKGNDQDVPVLSEGEPGFIIDTQDVIVGTTAGINIKLSKVGHGHAVADITNLSNLLAGKQDALSSGVNIKTINGGSIVGSGNLVISGTGDWTFIKKIVTADGVDAFTIDEATLGEAFDFDNFDYKFVYDGQTSDEDNSSPYIRFNNDSAPGRHSYVYQRLVAAADAGEPTQTTFGSYGQSAGTLINTGILLGSQSDNVGVTHLVMEFVITKARISTGYYNFSSYNVHGHGMANSVNGGTTPPITTINAMCQGSFAGSYENQGFDTPLTSIYLWHGITAGTVDSNALRVYKRAK